MLDVLFSYMITLVSITSIFMITRYVFLEPAMEEKKQRIFYIVSYVLITILCFAAGENFQGVIQVAYLFFAGLNIALGRKKRRLLGFLLFIPIGGMVDGVAVPFFIVKYLNLDDKLEATKWSLFIFVILGLLLLLFYVKGKNFRKWFRENMADRRPMLSEYLILSISGVVLLGVHGAMSEFIKNATGEDYQGTAVRLACCCEVFAFLLTITIVVLIMQGNYRKFYHDKVSGLQLNVIMTMADIVENRDSSTGGHIKRTAKYVEIIGKNLKKKNLFSDILTEQYLQDMVVAAPLHDIGKISVPDAILNKPGRLTDEEFEKMKNHALAGYDVLKKAENQMGDFDYLHVALDMAKYHHEWWNGKGYPMAIKGDEIPLCARIMAVADVFDALTSKRCYKEAMPVEKAYSIIREESGTHFDPVVAEVFLESADEIEKALREITDD